MLIVSSRRFALLRAYKDENGDCNVPETHPKLGKLVKNLRDRYTSGVLQKNHPGLVEKMTKLGFEWANQSDTTVDGLRSSELETSKKSKMKFKAKSFK